MLAILMSSYNGDEYISAQIESIISQTYKDWKLYIRDDGSTDNTLEIIRRYSLKDKRISLITDNVKHRGASGSFIYMLNLVSADYYMFSDQDDIWLSDKIEISLKAITQKNKNTNKPTLAHTDLKIVNKDLSIISESFWKYNGSYKWIGNIDILPVYNYITGCTMIFNKATREIAKNYNSRNAIMHDAWIALLTINKGGHIININQQTILYRQHGRNVVGAQKKQSIFNKLLYPIKIIRSNYKYFKMVKSISRISLMSYLRLKLFVFRGI